MGIGHLPHDTKETSLRKHLRLYGDAKRTNVTKDRRSGECGGFGIATMPCRSDGMSATVALDGRSLGEQMIMVNELHSGDPPPVARRSVYRC